MPLGTDRTEARSDDGRDFAQAPGASAFWSAASASIHQAIEAPGRPARSAPLAGGADTSELDESPVKGDGMRAGRARRLSRPEKLRLYSPSPASWRIVITTLAAACAAVGLLLVGSGAPRFPSSSKRAAVAGEAAVTGAAARGSAQESPRLARLLVARAIRRTGGRSRGAAARRRSSGRARRKADLRSPRPAAVVDVSYQTPASGTPASTSPATSAPMVSNVAPQPSPSGSSGTTSAGAGSSSTGSSSGSGPSGPGSPFGPGEMTGG